MRAQAATASAPPASTGAAGVDAQHSVRVQQRDQPREVAAASRRQPGVDDLALVVERLAGT